MSPTAVDPVVCQSERDVDKLPDDTVFLRSMLAETLGALRESRLDLERAKARIDQLLKRLYGPRSERLNPEQPLLFAELAASEPEPASAATPVAKVESAEPAKPKR